MRTIAWAGLAACTLLAVEAPSNAAAADAAAVSACLSSSAYLDFVETADLCDPASRVPGLDTKTRSAVNQQLGEAFYFAGRPGLAVPYLDEAIKFDPNADQAYRRRGWAHLMQSEFAGAMSDFTEFLALKPDDPDAQFAMAYARYQSGGRCDAAIRAYEAVLEQHPDHYITRYNLGGTYPCVDGHDIRKLEQFDLILAGGRDAVSKVTYFGRNGRDDLDFYAFIVDRRANTLMDLGRYDEAWKGFDWVIENYPRYTGALVHRSQIRTSSRDYLGGLDDAEKALALFPHLPGAQTAKLVALGRLKRDDEIISFADDVLSWGYESPETPRIYFWRARAYKRLGFKTEALSDFNRAMATDDQTVWSVHTHLVQSGYLFGPQLKRKSDDGGPPLDIRAKEFVNAVEACVVDPECMK